MKNFDNKNVDCHATLGMIEKRWGFPRCTLRALLGMTKSWQSGRSMIEMLGVLAIIGVLSVGGIAGYSKAMTKYRINKAIEQITLIAGNVRSFFAPQGNYNGVQCECYDGYCSGTGTGCLILKKAKILPDEMITLDADGKITAITNPFGGKVMLNRDMKAKSFDGKAFYIRYSIDSEEVCIELASHDWTAANVGVINFSNPGPQASGKGYFKSPVDIDTAVERCSAFITQGKQYGGYMALSFYFDVDVNSTYWQGSLNSSF